MALLFLSMANNILNNIIDDIESMEIAQSQICIPEDCFKYVNLSRKTMKILHVNIRSINKNFEQLRVLLYLLNFECDIIILSECWLSKVTKLPILEGYKSDFTKNTHNQNDGVVIYSKCDLNCHIIEPDFINSNCLVCHCGTGLTIVALYRSPSFNTQENYKNFLDSLNSVLSDISSIKQIAIVGDINIDIKPNNEDDRSGDYLSLLAFHGILPAHQTPTRMNNCLDHILLKTKNSAITLVIESYITDHMPVLLAIDDTVVASPKTANTCTHTDYNKVYEEINIADFSKVITLTDANESANALISVIQNITNLHTQIIRIPKKVRNIKPWITPGLVRCIRHRDRLHKRVKKSPDNDILRTTYCRYRNFCNNLLKRLKRAYEKTELEKCKNNRKALWNTIKKIANISKVTSPPVELLNSSPNPKESCNKICKYFANIGKNLATAVMTTYAPSSSSAHVKIPTKSLNSFVMLKVDEAEVEGALMSLRSDCAVGWDGITSKLLKACRHKLAPLITHVFNCSFATAIVPDAFKIAIIHPIYKNGDRDCVNNYRPISVLPAISKIFEKILNSRLLKYLEHNNILAANQYGFRAGISTEDAVSDLTECISRKLDRKQKCLGIFLDLTKAFDTVSVPILLSKLENVGVRGLQHDIFKDYLNNRKISVKVDTHLSDAESITYGVPQGSVLGPTLFLVYINELCKLSLPNAEIFTYADDTAIVVYGQTWTAVKDHAESSLRTIMNWLNSNCLTLNMSKTHFIPFSITSASKPPTTFTITAHTCIDQLVHPCTCTMISRMTNVRYLGVQIDDGMNWHMQLASLAARVRKLIYVFKHLRECADSSTLSMVYLALCQSIINYCISTWGSAAKTRFLVLERAQRAVLKVIKKRHFRYPTAELYSESQVLTVRQLYVLRSILRKHRLVPPPQPNRRSGKLVCPSEHHLTTFASRQFYVLSSVLYNKLNKIHNIVGLSSYELKLKLQNWLKTLDYSATEELLKY